LFTAPITSIDTSLFVWAVDTTVTLQSWRYEYGVDTISGDTLFVDSLRVNTTKDTFWTIPLPNIQQDSGAANQLSFAVDSTADKRYQLTILPNGITDFWGRTNRDTLSRIYTINPIDQYGSITGIVVGADSSQQYIVELVDKDNKAISRFLVQDSSTIRWQEYYRPTGAYTIRVSKDLNKNGRWDVGDYDAKQQPEPRYISSVIQLKAGWENSMELDLNKKAPVAGKGGTKKGEDADQEEGQEDASPSDDG
jgi:hypothetical protein